MFSTIRARQAQAHHIEDDVEGGMEQAIGSPPKGRFSVQNETGETSQNTPSDQPPEQQQTTEKYGAFPVSLPMKPGTSNIFIQETTLGSFYEIYWMGRVVDDPIILDIIQILDSATPGVTVSFYLSGPGGAADVAARLISAMRTTKATVKTYATGQCASSSAMIWSYGHERYVEPGVCLIFHMSSHGDRGNSIKIHDSALMIQKYIKSMLLDSKIRGSILNEDEIKAIIENRRDIYLTARTCMERGISISEPKGENYV